jgi:fucose permease
MPKLAITLAGVLIASFGIASFPGFLVTIVLLGAGAAILQVAANPIMRDVSSEGRYARNLSLGQFVKALGSLSGPLIPVFAARFFGLSWKVIFPVYSAAIILSLAAAVAAKLPSGQSQTAATYRSCAALLRNRSMLAMTAGIFLYVGAEVSFSAGIPLLLRERFALDVTRVGLLGTGLFFLALTIGRFCGGLILNWVKPASFLLATSALSLVGMIALFVPQKGMAIVAFFAVGLGFANIFPLIFSTAVDSMPERANEISGLLVTAIAGGAILPLITGFVADRSSVASALCVPIVGTFYVLALAFTRFRTQKLLDSVQN